MSKNSNDFWRILLIALCCALLIVSIKAISVWGEAHEDQVAQGALPDDNEKSPAEVEDSTDKVPLETGKKTEVDQGVLEVNSPLSEVSEEEEPKDNDKKTASGSPESEEGKQDKTPPPNANGPTDASFLRERLVIGYYTEDYIGDANSWDALQKNEALIDYTASFSFQLDGKGNLTAHKPKAVASGVPALALVHNYHGGWFDKDVASELLQSETHRQRAIDYIIEAALEMGFKGIHLDLENLGYENRNVYTQFVAKLAQQLVPLELGLSMAVPAKTHDSKDDWTGGFDYQALAPHVDFMVLMTYDQHWYGGSPGPIAAIDWVEQVVRYATSLVPSNKLVLGIAGYGYTWGNNGHTRAFSMVRTAERAYEYGAPIKWHDTYQVPYYTYTHQGVDYEVWYENEYSLVPKLRLVHDFDLGGIALWRLGFASEGFWQVVGDHR